MKSAPKNTKGTGKSGKETANEILPSSEVRNGEEKKKTKWPKTDSRYWLEKIFKPWIVENGERRQSKHYTARIQWQGKRVAFPLLSPNAEKAANRAARIFKTLQVKGWEATLKEFSPRHGNEKKKPALTVGEFMEAVEKVADIRPRTLADYMRSFRRIVSEIEGIEEDTKKDGKTASRFDYRSGGRKAWAAKVHAVKLAKITPAKVQQWKIAHVNKKAGDPVKERSARISANSYLRQAKSLFGKKILPHLKGLELPDVLPFEGVELFKRESMRYVSKIDAGDLLKKAQEKLAEKKPERWKIFILALGAGLRRKEIDTLLWRQVDFERGVIRIEATPYFMPKSEESAGEIEIDPELVGILRGFRARANGDFVIESDHEPKPGASYSITRAEEHFAGLCKWLRKNKVEGLRPLHTLRKEFGSIICQRGGLYAASRALRHADIQITAEHYLDRKERVTVGLGALMKPENVEGFEAA